jgi:hypothetical protein
MEGASHPNQIFNIEREFTRCVSVLKRLGILTLLPKSGSMGVLGVDGEEYPMPTHDQVADLFNHNSELISRKAEQGFDRLELTPIGMPVSLLIDRMETAILRHAAEGYIYQTRSILSDPLIPVRVSTNKPIRIWSTLRQVLDGDDLAYFPKEYSSNHRGMSKSEATSRLTPHARVRSLVSVAIFRCDNS